MGKPDNCSGEWPTSEVFIKDLAPGEQAMIGVCSALCLMDVIIFLDISYFVWSRHSDLKRTVVSTIWMLGLTPTLALLALSGMFMPRIYMYRDTLTVIFLAVAMYKFVQLLSAYYRHHHKIRKDLVENYKFRFSVGPCCCCCLCLPQANINRRNVSKVKIMVLQYPILSNIISIVMMMTWLNGNFEQGDWKFNSPYPYLTVTRIVSIITALWGLSIMVAPSKEALKYLLIGPKFATLRLCTALHAVQGVVFDLIVKNSDVFEIRGCFGGHVMGNFYESMVFCIEMSLISLTNLWIYRRTLAPADYTDNHRADDHDAETAASGATTGVDNPEFRDKLEQEIEEDLADIPGFHQDKSGDTNFINNDNKYQNCQIELEGRNSVEPVTSEDRKRDAECTLGADVYVNEEKIKNKNCDAREKNGRALGANGYVNNAMDEENIINKNGNESEKSRHTFGMNVYVHGAPEKGESGNVGTGSGDGIIVSQRL